MQAWYLKLQLLRVRRQFKDQMALRGRPRSYRDQAPIFALRDVQAKRPVVGRLIRSPRAVMQGQVAIYQVHLVRTRVADVQADTHKSAIRLEYGIRLIVTLKRVPQVHDLLYTIDDIAHLRILPDDCQ